MRLHALQYLRAVAALAVVYSHAVIQVDNYRPYLFEFGSFGVDLFFIISGFIMMYISKPTDTPWRFVVNRARRVIPLYWFFTILMVAILLIMPAVFKTTVFRWDAFIMSLLFIPHYSVANPAVVWPLVAPGWSLNYEMYFYLLFAISLLFARQLRLIFISCTILIVFIVCQQLDSTNAIVVFYSDSIVFEFVLGMLLALAWQRQLRLSSASATILIIVGFILLFLRLPLPRIAEFGLPSLLIVTGCLYIKVPENRALVLLGDASYALYLSHIFTLGIMRKFLPPILGNSAVAAYMFIAISLVVCVLVSIVAHKLVDNWLLRQERIDFLQPIVRREA